MKRPRRVYGPKGGHHLFPGLSEETIKQAFYAQFLKRFWQFVQKTEDCWVWTGKQHAITRYGITSVAGKAQKAHRISYAMHKGPIPRGALVLHSCDNRPCVNPEHLRLGTPLDNVRDMLARGRQNYKGPRDLTNIRKRSVRRSFSGK